MIVGNVTTSVELRLVIIVVCVDLAAGRNDAFATNAAG
jgi:hypothetical protein